MPVPVFRALNEEESGDESSNDTSSDEGSSSSVQKSSGEEDASGESSDEEELTPEAAEAAVQKQFQVALNLLVNGKNEAAKKQLDELLLAPIFFENHGSPSLLNLRYSCFKNLGDIHSQEDRPENAADSYLKASRIDGSDVCLWVSLGLEGAKSDNFLLSRYALERGLKADPESWRCLDKLISVLFILGDYSSCLYMIKTGLERDILYTKGHILKDEMYRLDPFLEEKARGNLMKDLRDVPYSLEEKRQVLDKLEPLIQKNCGEPDGKERVLEKVNPTAKLKDYSWESLGEALLEEYTVLTQSDNLHTGIGIVNPVTLTSWMSFDIPGVGAESVSCTNHHPMEVDHVAEGPKVEKSVQSASTESTAESVVNTPTRTEASSAADSGTDTTPATAHNSADESDTCNIVTTTEHGPHPPLDAEHPHSSVPPPRIGQKSSPRGRKKGSGRWRKSEQAGSVFKRRSSRLVPGFQMEDDYLRVRRAPLSQRIKECLPKAITSSTPLNSPARPGIRTKAQQHASSPDEAGLGTRVDELKASREEIELFLKENDGKGTHLIIDAFLCNLVEKYQTRTWSKELKTVFVKLVEAWSDYQQLDTPFNRDIPLSRLRSCGLIRLIFLELVTFWLRIDTNDPLKRLAARLRANVTLLGNFQRDFGSEWEEFGSRVEWLNANWLTGEMQELALVGCKQYLEGMGRDVWLPNAGARLSVSVVERKMEEIEKATLLHQVHNVFHEGRYETVMEILEGALGDSEPLYLMKDTSQQENRLEQVMLLCKSLGITHKLDELFVKHPVSEFSMEWNPNVELSSACETVREWWRLAGWLAEAMAFVLGRAREADASERRKWLERLQEILRMLKLCMKEERGSVLAHSHTLADLLVKSILVHQEWRGLIKFTPDASREDPWILLYEIAKQAEMDNLSEEYLKNWFKMADSLTVLLALKCLMLLRLAHEELGSEKLCTEKEGAFLLFFVEEIQEALKNPLVVKLIPSGCKDDMLNEAEQSFYCLYRYPNKKKRHLEEHSVKQIELTWDRAALLFDFLRPEDTPEFDGKRTDSVSADTVQMLHRIEGLVPRGLKPDSLLERMEKYLVGEEEEFWMGLGNEEPIICLLYYLMGDYYQKNADFPLALRYYSLDLCVWPERFDSWGGLALARTGILQEFLQSVEMCISRHSQLRVKTQAEKVMKCFQRAIEYQPDHLVLRMEYGGILYEVQGFFSRLKHKNEFKHVRDSAEAQQMELLGKAEKIYKDLLEDELVDYDTRRERWLQHYMMGKILEKQGGSPAEVLCHYHRSAQCVYREGARYKEKIKYEYGTYLELESLEIHYRVHASLLKWIQRGHFPDFLPLMWRYVNMFREHGVARQQYSKKSERDKQRLKVEPEVTECLEDVLDEVSKDGGGGKWRRRGVSTVVDEDVMETVVSLTQRVWMEEEIVSMSCDAMRLCIKRFFNHYKAHHRLAMAYLTLPSVKNIEMAKLVLLGPVQHMRKSERISMCLFQNRKPNNLFEGVWRIPQDDIDRNGSFNAHILRIVDLTLKVLLTGKLWKPLLDISYQLAKKPEKEKQFLCDEDRLVLCQRAADGALKLKKEGFEEAKRKPNSMHSVSTLFSLLTDSARAYNILNRQRDVKIDTSGWKPLLKALYSKITGKRSDDGTSETVLFRYIDDLANRLEREQMLKQCGSPAVVDTTKRLATSGVARKRTSSHFHPSSPQKAVDSMFAPPEPKRPHPPPPPVPPPRPPPHTPHLPGQPPPAPSAGQEVNQQLIAMLEAQLAFLRSGGNVKDCAGEIAKKIRSQEQLDLVRRAIDCQKVQLPPKTGQKTSTTGSVGTSRTGHNPVKRPQISTHKPQVHAQRKTADSSFSVWHPANRPGLHGRGGSVNAHNSKVQEAARMASSLPCGVPGGSFSTHAGPVQKGQPQLPQTSYPKNVPIDLTLEKSPESKHGKSEPLPKPRPLYRPYNIPDTSVESRRRTVGIPGNVLMRPPETAKKTIHPHSQKKRQHSGTAKSPIRID